MHKIAQKISQRAKKEPVQNAQKAKKNRSQMHTIFHQKWCIFFEKRWRKTLKKIVCYDINYIGKIDKIFETKNGGKTC